MVASEALDRLIEGNARFISGETRATHAFKRTQLQRLSANQAPFAVILGCSDSRVPVEIVFDQGFGQLFVVRVAGNVVNPPVIGSVEFAVSRLGVKLVVVLGHSHCGAVQAGLESLVRASTDASEGLGSILGSIRAAVEGLTPDQALHDPAASRRAVRANVRESVGQLQEGSEIIRRSITRTGVVVVGAEYSLQTGAVEFFDGVPETA